MPTDTVLTRSANLFNIPAVRWGQASPAVRDRFLNALDGGDTVAIEACSRDVSNCVVNLPGETCIALSLAHGSSYADAARAVGTSDGIEHLPPV